MSFPSTPPRAKPPTSNSQRQATPGPQTKFTSTPIRKSRQGSEHFATLSKGDADILKDDMARELGGQWVGPMPVVDFISTFLPLSENVLRKQPAFSPEFFKPLAVQSFESAMYDPFIKLVSSSPAIPGFRLVNTSQYADRDAVTGMKNKPDVSCYKSTVDVSKRPTRYEEMETLFEFKTAKVEADPFEDNPKKTDVSRFPFEPQSDERKKCRGQMACYARTWCARQHRTHCFVVWIADPSARIIRIDRSGGIVSAKFNYRTHGHLLLEFLWHLSQSCSRIRGVDTTVSVASKDEAAKAKDKLYKWSPTSRRSVFKLQVPDPVERNDKNTRYLFVWGLLADPRSVTGRATRVYPAWDPKWNGGKGRVVIIKDSWRSCEDFMEKETDILKELNEKSCRNIPQLICGDDIPDHFTLTKQYASQSWNIGAREENLVKRVHIRFAEDVVGCPLSFFNASREFFRAIYDAVIAHKDAYEKCGILHRDISSNNILICNGGRGILNDWDLSKHVEGHNYARQKFRSGTWQFMAASLLQDPRKLNTVQDDLESVFWVVVYHMMRHMKSNLELEGLAQKMYDIFDHENATPIGEERRGGDAKIVVLTRPSKGNLLTSSFSIPTNAPLTHFFHSMLGHWKKWYQQTGMHEDEIDDFRTANKDISLEDALKAIPFDDSSLAMRNHDALIAACEIALSQEALWPVGDFSVDLVPERIKRPKSDSEYESDEENVVDETGDLKEGIAKLKDDEDDLDYDGAPYKKTRHANDPDYEFKGRRGDPLPSRQTRGQTQILNAVDPNGSLQQKPE